MRSRLLPVCAWGMLLLAAGALGAAEEQESQAAQPPLDVDSLLAGREPTSVAELKAMEERQRKLAEQVTACTVGVVVGAAHGSGVIVTADGYVLTAAHVASEPHRKLRCILPDGREVRGESCGLHRTLDAGLVKLSGPGPWPHAEMAPADEVKLGQWCLTTGHPGGFERGRQPVVRLGRVLQVNKQAIVTDCTLVGGDSGGPLFDMRGRVIGINSRIGAGLTVNMHVPIGAFREVWDRLVQGEAWGHLPGTGPFLGVRGDGKPEKAKVAGLVPDGPAAKAGVQVGDVIVKLGDKPVKDFPALQTLINERQAGDKVKLEILRGEQTVTLEVTLGRQTEED